MAYEEFNTLTEQVIGAAITVHKELGPGFTERIYSEALQVELRTRQISFTTEQLIRVQYRGQVLGQHRLDLMIGEKLVVELKAVYAINRFHVAQMLSYLKASGKNLGLILNFARNRVEIRRIAL